MPAEGQPKFRPGDRVRRIYSGLLWDGKEAQPKIVARRVFVFGEVCPHYEMEGDREIMADPCAEALLRHWDE